MFPSLSFTLENPLPNFDSFIKKGEKFLDKYTDILSSACILAITTSLVAEKIFPQMPKTIPRIGKVIYNFGGIIWLNVQVKDFIKSCNDLYCINKTKDWNTLIPVAAKVFVKAVNILLTVAIFSGSVIAAIGYPHIMMSMTFSLQPLSLTTYFIDIASDIYDFRKNSIVIKEINALNANNETITKCFIAIIHSRELPNNYTQEEHKLARSIIQQLDLKSIQTFQKMDEQVIDCEKIKKALLNKNVFTIANLGLIVLGRITMGVSKAYPETLADMSGRWLMSALYTTNLIRHQFFLDKELDKKDL